MYIHMYGKEDLEVDACAYMYNFYFKSLYGLDHAGGVYFLATL